jgi:hypothetical protein
MDSYNILHFHIIIFIIFSISFQTCYRNLIYDTKKKKPKSKNFEKRNLTKKIHNFSMIFFPQKFLV